MRVLRRSKTEMQFLAPKKLRSHAMSSKRDALYIEAFLCHGAMAFVVRKSAEFSPKSYGAPSNPKTLRSHAMSSKRDHGGSKHFLLSRCYAFRRRGNPLNSPPKSYGTPSNPKKLR